MKELSIEEKAKRYDEAISIAREYDFSLTGVCAGDVIQDIFTELAESEDEKIKKYIKQSLESLMFTKGSQADIERNNAIAWLEKQGERKAVKWSHKDAKYLAELWEVLSVHRSTNPKVDSLMEWVKEIVSLIRQEWSEEDEKMMDIILNDINYAQKNFSDSKLTTYDKKVEWLKNKFKSLRPQSQWKPSDEHYELEEFAKIVRGNLTGISKTVQNLFEAKYLQLTGNKMYGGFKD